ncbi:vanadium-dependent haloperoxidase [Spongiimicrobium sp. 3-5]|uniref:vanadium-dependent haloperoxidase n=1 Tax=Spongiimicrobium sp. 3-5 TaxID=3332596 RepID=UPI00397FAC3A
MSRTIYMIIGLLVMAVGCNKPHDQAALDSYFEGSLATYNGHLTDVIVADIFTPPVASRIYSYPNIAAYESIRFMDPSKPSLVGKLNGLSTLSEPSAEKSYYYPLASLIAFTGVAKALVYDQERVEALQKKLLEEVTEIGIDKKVYANSVQFGETISKEILGWAAQDGYLERTALPRYSVSDDASRWRPTPPDYMESIEPHWSTLRPFMLDSAQQFRPLPPTVFDTIASSQFFAETKEVYETVKNLSKEQLDIAKFWDCNPNVSYTQGHVMYFKQQISPGGHWIMIACQVIQKEKLDPVRAAEVLSKLGLTIADAFISCWDEKYRSSLTRPETYINTYMDPDWKPILQTPAFPEHTSGHSVASAAAATMLTHLFGDNYAFKDSTEVKYGLPVRSYNSFREASNEAAISRLYGGIHYRPAISSGLWQGNSVGDFIVKKVSGDE